MAYLVMATLQYRADYTDLGGDVEYSEEEVYERFDDLKDALKLFRKLEPQNPLALELHAA